MLWHYYYGIIIATNERNESFCISIGGEWVDVKNTEISLLRI